MKKLDTNYKTFESIKYIDEFDIEYWSARELMSLFKYSKWRICKKL